MSNFITLLLIQPFFLQILRKKLNSDCQILNNDTILSIQYLADQVALCIATIQGEIILWHIPQDEVN